MDKETIEEAAERESSLFYEKGSLDWNKYRQVFIEGAKWQQNRSYSEEEVINIIYKIYDEMGISISLEDVLEQFKKK